MNFDPMTGQPINQGNVTPKQDEQVIVQPIPPVQPVPTVEQVSTVNNNLNPQQQIQNIPTVEQSKQEFIDNTQANNTIKKDEKKDGPNIAFIIILFAIIFAAIFFLFPYLLKVL